MEAIRLLVASIVVGAIAWSDVAGAQAAPPRTTDAWLSNPDIPYPVAVGIPGEPSVGDRSEILPAPWTPRTSYAPSALRGTSIGTQPQVAAGGEVSATLAFPATNASFGFAPGYAGLQVADIDGDSRNEVLAIAQGVSAYWYIADWTPAGLSMRYVSRGYPAGIVDSHIIDVGGARRLAIATSGTLYVYSLPGATLLATASMPANLRRARVVDVDGDGTLEVVTLTGGSYYYYPPYESVLAVIDLATGVERWRTQLFPARIHDLVVGDFSDDPGQEIVLAGEGSVVRSASTGAVLWQLPATEFVRVAAGNFDADPGVEFAMMMSWSEIRVFDGRQQSEAWRLTGMGDLESVAAWDFDKDGRDELLQGDGQWGSVCAYSSINQARLNCIVNREHGVGRIAAGDVDGVPGDEVLWGAGFTSSARASSAPRHAVRRRVAPAGAGGQVDGMVVVPDVFLHAT